jgi:hypothetical protein
MERDMAGLLEHLDELIKENKRTLTGFYVRGDKVSREQARQDGRVRGLRIARQVVAEWIEEDSTEATRDPRQETRDDAPATPV